MKHLIAALALMFALAVPAKADNYRSPVYVISSTWTLGGTGTKAFAFQNTSSTYSVVILKVNIFPITTSAITGGAANFDVRFSTKMTHGGTTQVSFASYQSANETQQSYVLSSTGPVNVQYEGKTAGASQLPFATIPGAFDETSSNSSSTSGNELTGMIAYGAEDILLPKKSNRGIVIEQKQFGPTDWTAGTALLQIFYTIR